MIWKFWEKKKPPEPQIQLPLPPPGPLPQVVFQHLVDELELGPDWVNTLFCVTRPVAGQTHLEAFRAFSPSQMAAKGIAVCDYGTLDEYRQMVLFSGTLNTETGVVILMPEIKRRAA